MKASQVKERVRTHRGRLRAAGFRPVQLWVPDTKAAGFAAECTRQSLIVQQDADDLDDLVLFADLADWGEE